MNSTVNGRVIVAEGVTRTYRIGANEVHAVRDVSLTIEKGRFVVLMGPSGCGKTTLLNLFGCIDQPTSGRLEVFGTNVDRMSEKERSRLRLTRIGFVFQRFFLLPMLTAAENVELPMIEAGMPRARRMRRAMELLDGLGLRKRYHHRPHQLSGGEMQRVAIARAMANEPELIIADEPTGELDHAAGLGIVQTFKRLQASGITLLMATHNPEIAGAGDVIVRLQDGEMI